MTGKGKGKPYLINKPKSINHTSDDSTEDSSCKWGDLTTPPQGGLPNLDIEGIKNPPLRDPYYYLRAMKTFTFMETHTSQPLMNRLMESFINLGIVVAVIFNMTPFKIVLKLLLGVK
jgi:hypothetical protein